MLARIQAFSSWKLAVVLTAAHLLFPTLFLPWSMQPAAHGLGPLDLLLSYSPEVAYEHLASFGPEGRAAYARTSLFVDTAYPLVYGSLFVVLLIQLLKSIGWNKAPLTWLCFTPLITMGFDFAENACVLFMLNAFPARHDDIASLASGFTSLKWISVGGVLFLVLGLTLSTGWKYLVRYRTS